MLHSFSTDISSISLPEKFTYPFHYTPHPLCILAAEEVQAYLQEQEQWRDELAEGKMFGVLIVQTVEGKIGYLATFSGNLAGKNVHKFFVPPVYDLLQPDGYFKQGEEQISAINRQITELKTSKAYQQCLSRLKEVTIEAEQEITSAKSELKVAKEAREEKRKKSSLTPEEEAEMIRQSQHQKAEFKRLERRWKEQLAVLKSEADVFEQEIARLGVERKAQSAALQQWIFKQFRMLSAQGEVKDLGTIFESTPTQFPPAGAGECAAPKLLQYAYLHQLKPIAMAEFWWGASPKTEIRRHGYYYPACKGKCEPILNHMLKGLNVDDSPFITNAHRDTKLTVLFEDEYLLVVNKPAGMLSVPGKGETDSVYQRLRQQYPEATGPMIVHRLDMATSGILLIAKAKESHQNLQAQFKNRTVKKRYIALLEGVLESEEGTISLPLCLDPLDRPRQIVNEEYGKPAITRYEVIGRNKGRTRIVFYPLTGRTHQLRVHAAHPQGLNIPIAGDELYGQKAERLYLHAEYIEFRHPVSGDIISIHKKAEF